MNRNRMLIGLGVAILVALLVSNFVYRKFQQATRREGRAHAPDHRGGESASAGHAPGFFDAAHRFMASEPAGHGNVHANAGLHQPRLDNPVSENEPILQSKLAPVAAGAGLCRSDSARNAGDVGGGERRSRRGGIRDAGHDGGRDGDRSGRGRARRAEHHANDS